MTNDNIVSTVGSEFPIYAWFNNGTVYLYSQAEQTYLDTYSDYLFYNMKALTTVD